MLKEGGVDEHAETKESLHSQSGEKQRELIAVGKRFRKCLKGPIIDHADLLYDEKGLPK